MGHSASSVCCQEERYGISEAYSDAVHDAHYSGQVVAAMPLFTQSDSMPSKPGQRWGCCKANDEIVEYSGGYSHNLESLSYVPVRFDEDCTIDHDRSHIRYSKTVVHSTRARTQRRARTWEEWLKAATTGRTVTLLHGLAEAGTAPDPDKPLDRIPAMYLIDRGLKKLSVLPTSDARIAPVDTEDLCGGSVLGEVVIPIDNIQVVCPAMDFMLIFDQVDSKLEESEKSRAVLLQYTTETTERRRVVFLEESEAAKERFVQALTALWLEKRNDHSMWF